MVSSPLEELVLSEEEERSSKRKSEKSIVFALEHNHLIKRLREDCKSALLISKLPTYSLSSTLTGEFELSSQINDL